MRYEKLEQYLKNVFLGENVIDCYPRSFIKICYGRHSAKKKDLEYFKARKYRIDDAFPRKLDPLNKKIR